jgi:PBP1b-binding outer membrane lipoprotein LpoB
VLNTIQRPLSVALTLVCALVLAGCVNTPAAHDERSTKAAGVASISTETLPAASNSELHDLEPIPLEGEEGERGLVRVNLTGTQLVEYLDSLNMEAHSTGIMRSSSYNPAAASRVYTAVSEVVDQISVRRDEGEPDPEVIIDDTVGDEQE